ncbi:MAG: class I SAM-dependent methyltransferase [Promethearchaeota archaeon]|nr:MAG: class I SAM-dependent methyltransferase [Candidatus Lokiarchaeota archaeon]
MAKTPPFMILRSKLVSRLKELESEGTILDLGCGSGNLLIKLAKKFPKSTLIGVDTSSEMLEKARKRAGRKGLNAEIELKVGAANNIPFPDNSIDIIVSSFSLHHWEDPAGCLKEVYRVLKKDGSLLIFDFRRDARRFWYGLLTFATKIVVPKALKQINEPLGSLQAGYTVVESREILTETPFKEFQVDSWLAWMFIKGMKL